MARSMWRRSPAQGREEAGILERIGAFEPELERLDDEELERRGRALREREGRETPVGPLEETLALVREIGRRTLGERLRDVQILAGLALHRGRIAEMQTGEGKTLAAVAPLALAALAGKGAHLLTFNDYLARRDAAWMGPIYARLGLSVGCVADGMDPGERRAAYAADVTYLTVKEAGFDFLRDGLALDPRDQVHRPLHFALIDEADSILIDEARIPMVIAGRDDEQERDLPRLAALARLLRPGGDFDVDEGGRNIALTERGAERAERHLGCGSLFVPRNLRLLAELRNALHAQYLLRRDVDYIVRGGEIELVDELTGRVAENRIWPDGLQAALEAKEGVAGRPEGRILGSITIQHYLRRYPRLGGMTATARPAARELAELYGLEVVPVPTYRPCVRIDRPDRIFLDAASKRRAVVAEVARQHAAGRPILVGTASVRDSEALAADLARAGIGCRVLNARQDAGEAAIVAEAGAPGAVTISTNMAGRGTDIKLGGAREWERERAVALGGLYLLAMQRHDSRRIDDQLRGRAGRQGDPGESCFFLSLEDDLARRCGVGRLVPAMAPGVVELDHPRFGLELAHAQRVIEGEHGDIRKRLYLYARVLEAQRAEIQEWRQEVLEERDEAPLLARRCPELWSERVGLVGEEGARAIGRRLTLHAIDRCWSDHLGALAELRDELPTVRLDGREPLAEFYRVANQDFQKLCARIDERIVELFERITVTGDGVDWEAEGLRGPSATWTYLVNDQAFGGNTFLTLANRASFGLMASLAAGPILLLWGLARHWRRWRSGREARAQGPGPST